MEKGLRKGPWSQQEDVILNEYVKRYGPQNWNAVQRLTGLPRDGKSCRLRWLNHLDPDLKRGKFSIEEKYQILLLRQLGCKWSNIAEQIPGRTDNEIKNFWNTNERKKRKMETGNKECQKRKKKINYLSLNGEILKPWDNELNNNNGKSSNQQQDICNTHEMELMKDSFHIPIMQPSNMLCNNVASTSIKNNSFPTFIDRGEAPFMPTEMVSNVPLFLEFHPCTSISHKPSPTFIDRGETSFISKDIESNQPPPFTESINFQSFESLLIQKYPPLPLRSFEEIQQEQLELDSDDPFNNNLLESMVNTSKILDDSNGNLHSCETRLDGKKPTYLKKDESNCETRLVDENGKKPTSLKKDESNCETRLVDENGKKPTYLKKDESNCETRLVDENGKKPTYLKKDESNCETRLVDENEKKPTSLKKDESNSEDLIDLLDSLGWLDCYIF